MLAGEDQVSGEWRKYDETKVRNGRVKGQKKVVACNQATAKEFHILVEAMTRFRLRVKFGYFQAAKSNSFHSTFHYSPLASFSSSETGQSGCSFASLSAFGEEYKKHQAE